MELQMKGKIRSIQQEFPSRKTLVTLELEESPANVETLKEKILKVVLKPFRKDRSQEANAYYWKLCSQIAAAKKVSKTEEHNWLLKEYGQNRYTDGVLDWSVKPMSFDWTRCESEHYQPSGRVVHLQDGTPLAIYWVVRGSHTYNTEEMAQLIDGAIHEAEECGIDPRTPDEIARMTAVYKEAVYGKTERSKEVRGGGAA